MHFMLKSHKLRLYLPHNKPKQTVEFHQNRFSCLFKLKNSRNLIPLSSVRREQITKANCSTFDVSSLESVCGKLCEYSTKQTKQNKGDFALHRFFSDLIKSSKFEIKMAPILAPTVKLNNGYEMPVLGLGTYELKKQKCENILQEALNIGYRHIDTAYLYRNESIIGKILKEKFENKTIKREEIFLVTKLWNIYHEPKMVIYACKKQMEALQVNYIDLYLMHSPIGYKYENDEALKPHHDDKLQTNDVDFVDTYKAMEELVALGWVRSLGLSNFDIPQMKRILDNCKIIPVTNQVECHPALNQQKLRIFCKQHDIFVTAYSPLARPKSSKPLPQFYESVKLHTIAEKYHKTKAQVVLRYLIDIGTLPIPKSSRPEKLLENINVFDFHLSSEEIAIMNSFNTGMRIWRDEKAKFHEYWPFNEE